MTHAGRCAELSWQVWPVSVGLALAAWSQRGLCAVFLADDEAGLLAELASSFPGHASRRADMAPPWVPCLLAVLNGELHDPARVCDVPLEMRGTPFQQSVWSALRTIPSGQTVSYTELAQRLGEPKAVRAVASACAANLLAVLIPCHRVVRRDGSLSGYRWGQARKQALLAREASFSMAPS